ncbi:MAG: ABC transporter substrate-binding protein [Gammaproteobacteria bacterium]|nr:ABC transporter substrate-binding protein [Gammaproteobacteria bacterium]
MKFIKQLGIFLVLAICWSGIVYANAGDTGAGPKAVVEKAANDVISTLDNEGESIRNDPDKVYGLVNELILPHFDFDKMSYFVLGKVWKTASEQQKLDFQNEFKQLLINTYTTALLEFSSEEKIIYKDVKVSPKNKNVAIVPTEIRQKGTNPIDVTYRMYRTGDQWRIYDVIIDGVSLVTNYRANFAGEVRSNGLDGLIRSLGEHNQPNDVVTIQPAAAKTN